MKGYPWIIVPLLALLVPVASASSHLETRPCELLPSTKLRPLPRAEFQQLVAGKTMEAVKDALGEPDYSYESGNGYRIFQYYQRTINPATRKRDPSVTLTFENERVKYTQIWEF